MVGNSVFDHQALNKLSVIDGEPGFRDHYNEFTREGLAIAVSSVSMGRCAMSV